MRGHDPLIALRRRGFTPLCVWIDATGQDSLQQWREWHQHRPLQPHLDIDPTETVARLDLRCLHGVPAVFLDVAADDTARQLALIEAIRSEAVPRVVVTLVEAGRVADVFLADLEVAHG